MKRALILLAISVLSMCILFADGPSNRSDNTIYGYYNGAGHDKKIVLSIKDIYDNAVYQTGTVTVNSTDATYDPENDDFSFNAFKWSLAGLNYGGSISVTFKFSALLAYVAGTGNYYVPVHHFNMTLDDYDAQRVTITSTGSTSTDVGTKRKTELAGFTKNDVYSSYPYGGSGGDGGYSGEAIYRSITYTFTEPEPDANSVDDVEWEESGMCGVYVSDYFHMAGTSAAYFHYNSNVTVNVTVN